MNSLEIPIGLEPSEAKALDLSADPGKFTLPDGDTLLYFNEAFQIADEMRSPRKQVWDKCWALYNNQYDWTGKEPWQAQIAIPKVRGTVDRATGAFRRALVRLKRFYQIESETRLGVEKGMFTMSLMDYWLDQIDFVQSFSEGLKSGLITSTIVYKVWWNWITDYQPRYEDRLLKEPILELGIKVGERMVPVQELVRGARITGQLGLKAVNPYNFWVGPRDSYRIERATVDYAYLWEMADRGVYQKEAVAKLADSANAKINRDEEAKRKNEGTVSPINKHIREVDIYHYWGPLYSAEGRLIARNATLTVGGMASPEGNVGSSGGATAVLRKPQANPFFHGTDPYIVGTPYIVPFSTYNRGIVEDIAGIAKMMTELSCLVIDGAQFDAMQAFEIDSDLLEDPRQVKKGVYPGVAFATKGMENQSNKSVIRPIQTGKVPQLALQVLAFLDRESQLSSSVTNSMRGQDIGSKTATEFTAITGMAAETIDDAARTVEETTIDVMLDKVAKTIYQYHEDFNLPRLTENFGQTSLMLSDMTPEERYATMVGGFHFKARGVSIFLDKGQDLQRVTSFLQLIANIPGILTRINIDEMLQEVIVAMGWNPAKILPNSQQGVVPAAMMGGQAVPQGPDGMPALNQMELTPAQMSAGQQGAQQGGARHNPMAGFGFAGSMGMR